MFSNSPRHAILLKKQEGRCGLVSVYFRSSDVVEVDHIKLCKNGGKSSLDNLQLIHGHCHDLKSVEDNKLCNLRI